MGAGLIAINVFFVAFVLVAICGSHLWAIRTAHRDHHSVKRSHHDTVDGSLAIADLEQRLAVEEPVAPVALEVARI